LSCQLAARDARAAVRQQFAVDDHVAPLSKKFVVACLASNH
jgi:hypothetical protein